ncbi:hypothetical protein NLJ89_g11845 [Agrocybe chaxingu]|uniref:DUF2433 domain-containing protein n=1 Tax=Agrocybe chaxingu TaxID=84603 RepID=A0A9W8MQT5_9AGAR|nr:hypothetical protein NLJ89_g11845 [Agrocybe chaxingu]
MYSPLIPSAQRTHLLAPENPPSVIRSTVNIELLSEFPLLLSGQIKLQIPSLHGVGWCPRPPQALDNGDGNATIAGGQGTMWTTILQIGELVDTAQRVFDPSETRLLVTHASPGREGIMAQLALVLKADLTVSAGLHFRYATSYNEFSVQGDFEGFRHKLVLGKDGFDKVWESVKTQVDAVIDEHQRVFLDKALSVVERLPPAQPSSGPGAAATGEEPAWKNCWNWNLCDAAYGSLVLDVKDGRVSAELKSFNYAYRRSATVSATPNSATSALPAVNNSNTVSNTQPPTKGPTPVPADRPTPPHLNNKSNAPTPPPQAAPCRSTRVDGQGEPYLGGKDLDERNKSPVSQPGEAGSTGTRTPKTGKPPRNPWTIFMRMAPHTQVVESEIREFFGEAKDGITKVNMPHPFAGKPRLAYVEFGDEEAMKAGLEKHAEVRCPTTFFCCPFLTTVTPDIQGPGT